MKCVNKFWDEMYSENCQLFQSFTDFNLLSRILRNRFFVRVNRLNSTPFFTTICCLNKSPLGRSLAWESLPLLSQRNNTAVVTAVKATSHLCVKFERPLIITYSLILKILCIIFTQNALEEKNRGAQVEKLALSQL